MEMATGGNDCDDCIKPKPIDQQEVTNETKVLDDIDTNFDAIVEILKDKSFNFDDLDNLSSFKEFQLLHDISAMHKKSKLDVSQHDEDKNKFIKGIKTVLSYWDIVLLILLNCLFVAYLSMFLTVYYKPDTPASYYIQEIGRELYKRFVTGLYYVNGIDDITTDTCVFEIPDFLSTFLRPITNCNICVNMKQIEKLESISREEFELKYAYTSVPVVIKNALTNWTAMQTLNFKYLKNLYSNIDQVSYKTRQELVNTFSNKDGQSSKLMETFGNIVESEDERNVFKETTTCQFFPYRSHFNSLEEVLQMNEDSDEFKKPWYVGWSNCNSYASEELRKLYNRPHFLPKESEMSKLDWIFMGVPGYGASN
jgi:hypothetical protein